MAKRAILSKTRTVKMVGERIRSLRNARGMSQKDLAALIEYSSKQIARWEAGSVSPPTDVLERIADRMGVTMAYLSGATEDMRATLQEKDLRAFEKLLHAARLLGEAASFLQDAINELAPAHIKD
jgi:transcriptional regulator with XRE-family HTH domain